MADLQDLINTGFNFEKPQYLGGGSATNVSFSGTPKTSSGGGSSNTANEIDWIARKVELLESKISDLADTAADAYEPWSIRNQALEDEIEATIRLMGIQEEAYEKYMEKANAIDISDEYKRLVQEGGDIVETFENQDLYNAINEYKDYYDQAQECQDKIEELIKSVKTLNNQKLDDLISQYEDLNDRTDAYIRIMEVEENLFGADYSEEKIALLIDNANRQLEGFQKAKAQLRDNLEMGTYGHAEGTVMLGNYAVNTRAFAESTEAAAVAMKSLGLAAETVANASEHVIANTEELINDAGENTGVFIEFTPVLSDGTVIDSQTWESYLNKITNNGKITSEAEILAADRQGYEINGQNLSNLVMSVVSEVPEIIHSAMQNASSSIDFSGALSDVISSIKQYLLNNVFTIDMLNNYGISGEEGLAKIQTFIDQFIESYFDETGFVVGSDIEQEFNNSLDNIMKYVFASFQGFTADYFSKIDSTESKVPDYMKKSEGYAEQYTESLENVAEQGERAEDATKAPIDAIINKYADQLAALDSQIDAAFTENKGIVGGGTSLNEQISLLEQENDILRSQEEGIWETVAQLALLNGDSATYEYAMEKLADIGSAINDNAAKIVEAILNDFNKVVQAYDNAMGLLEHRANMINMKMELADLQGYMASGVYYEALIANAQEELALLKQEKEVLQEKLDAAVDSGYVEVYSEAWYEMQNQINEVDEAILQTEIDIQEFSNTIRQIEWDRFDYMQESINALNDEFEFLLTLIKNSEDLIDDYGNFTDYGWTSISLYQKQFETYAHLVSNYRKEIADLDTDFASDSLNKDYIERRQELLETEREYILAQQEAKNAIIALAEEAYDKQLEKLQEIIDKKKESLQAEKDLYDYQKKVRDQTKDIADIQKQLTAYATDDSEEAKKTIQELKVDLKDAMSNLQDTEYDKYISDQEQMMDRLYSDYEDWIDMRLDDTDSLIEDLLAQVDEKGGVIEECLTEITGTWNYDRLIESVESIEAKVTAMFERADAKAQEDVQWVYDNTITQPLDTIYNGETTQSTINKANSSSSSSGGSSSLSTNSSSSSSSSSSGPPDDDWYKNNHSSPSIFSPQYQNSNGDDYSTYGVGTKEYEKLVLTAASNGYNLSDDKAEFGDTEWYKAAEEILKQNKSSYATGGPLGKAIKASGEDGIFFGRMGEEIVTPEELDKLSNIFEQADLMKNLQTRYNFPTSAMGHMTSMGDVNFEITLPNVQNYEQLKAQLIRDPNFEKATLTMVNNAVVGKSSLAKLKYS